MNPNIALFTRSVPLWEHFLHGYIPGVAIVLLIWIRGWKLLRGALERAWTILTNAITNFPTEFRVWKGFTKVNSIALLILAVLTGTLSYGAGYSNGFGRGYRERTREIYSRSDQWEHVGVVSKLDATHFTFYWKQNTHDECIAPGSVTIPFLPGEILKEIRFTWGDDGCWNMTDRSTGWDYERDPVTRKAVKFSDVSEIQ